MIRNVEKLILGTVQLGMNYGINNTTGKPTEEEAIQLLSYAARQGVKLLDTAPAYGTALQVIEKYQANNPPFNIISKFTVTHDSSIILNQVQQQLQALQIPSFYCYHYHKFSDFTKFPQLQKDLINLKEKGLIERIGVSIYTNEEMRMAINSPFIDVIQLPFNLLDNTNLRGEVVEKAKLQDKEIHIRSVFLQGLFFKEMQSIPGKLRPLIPYLEQIRHMAHQNELTVQELAMAYVFTNPYIDYVLIGIDSQQQLASNLQFLNKVVDAECIRLIDTIRVKEFELLNPVNWN
ncbi:aldo/keto reductase [Rhodocytophaga aerolata]|uniref:Aldo/keto reductase n=1 Tax=Rhodocytophaga aerolata TaxID=455078 RepID=A0ABT8R2Z2_9BACT|nr:aldo/keto reductase [Rhodocytophaga aerolata]MDO1445137.1 aldo/keto reductase [Rhodocytophaga aerolata]